MTTATDPLPASPSPAGAQVHGLHHAYRRTVALRGIDLVPELTALDNVALPLLLDGHDPRATDPSNLRTA